MSGVPAETRSSFRITRCNFINGPGAKEENGYNLTINRGLHNPSVKIITLPDQF